MGKFYITNAIPYVNAKPHIGHALEYFQADTIRRYHQITGDETLLLSGADENALKNVQAAEKEGVPIHQFLDRNSKVFQDTFAKLGVKLDVFQRGSDTKKHWLGVQKHWQLCLKNGDIYKKTYEGLYCVGCESFKIEKDLVNGLCPDHQKAPEKIKEENYFFKLSTYQKQLEELIENNTIEIIPENKRSETLAFVKAGLEDFSISRSKERAKNVGVPVPGDPDQIIYVWFDALDIYITGIGFGADDEKFNKWWPADLHIIGKDINRFHTIYWPAMLLSARLSLPKQILIHSFVNVSGQKMSKSVGNVIDPLALVSQFGLEPLRYYLLSQIPLESDGDFSEERFKEVYNADLANGLGNLVARIAKLCETSQYAHPVSSDKTSVHLIGIEEYSQAFEEFRFNDALSFVWRKIKDLDKFINDEKPWDLLKSKDRRLKTILAHAVDQIQEIAALLEPFLPETAKIIEGQFKGPTIESQKPLFPRL